MSEDTNLPPDEAQHTSTRDRVVELLGRVSPEARQLVGEVLRLEQAQIHKKVATGIAGDIVDISKKIVK